MTSQQLKKATTRFYPVLINGLRSIINPFISIAFSYIIVNYFSKALWGHFVEYILFFLIANIICDWGSKSYLLRLFSKNPKAITANWQHFFLARTLVCFLFVAIILIVYPWELSIHLILWLFGVFIYNSCLVIIFYNRDYIKSIAIELFGFLVLTLQLFIYRDHLDLILLIQSYAYSIVAKAFLSIIFYYEFLKFKSITPKLNVLILGFPFFVLGVMGFLQTKVDVYVFSFFYDGKPLGEYQIISGFFIFATSFINLLVFPFIKNLYRLKAKSLQNMKALMINYGIGINLCLVLLIYVVLLYAFDIKLSILQLCIGYGISFPPYVYTSHIYNLIKNNRETIVMKIGVWCVLVNLVLSVILLYLNYNITGVLLANAITQIFCMLYSLKFRIYAN